MRATAIAMGLVLALALTAAAQRVPPTDIRAVDAFIDAPHALFGRSRASVKRALGPPTPVRARTLPGGRSAPIDPIDELVYPGIVLGISRGPAGLRRVEIREPRWALPSGLNVGVARDRVEASLGEPQAVTDASALYLYADGFPNTVEFHFRDGRVQRIEWLYAPAD
jgi:hypothetical protein